MRVITRPTKGRRILHSLDLNALPRGVLDGVGWGWTGPERGLARPGLAWSLPDQPGPAWPGPQLRPAAQPSPRPTARPTAQPGPWPRARPSPAFRSMHHNGQHTVNSRSTRRSTHGQHNGQHPLKSINCLELVEKNMRLALAGNNILILKLLVVEAAAIFKQALSKV